MKYTLEICTDSVASAVAAQKGGAKRIELCSGLVIGGLSPDPALFKVVRANTDLEIRTLLRPRFGDFCYDEYEFEMLKEEVQMYREFGADGVVIGILRPDGTMNVEQMEELVRISGDMKVTMHRAFDVCKDPYETMCQPWNRYDPDQRTERFCMEWKRNVERAERKSERQDRNPCRSRNQSGGD